MTPPLPTAKPLISLFSGAMGLDLGLESAGGGIKTAVAVEIDRIAVKTIQCNKADLAVFNESIEDISTKELLASGKLKCSEAFAVIGGPCCQSFSTVGKRASLGDEKRGGLFRHFTRVVKEAKPRFFVMENVKGMLSAAIKHRPLNKRGPGHPPLSEEEELGSALKTICTELEKLNYYVIYGLVNCADYGVPQKRYRVIFIGSRDGEPIQLPKPTHSELGTKSWITLKDAIGTLKDPAPEYLPFSAERREIIKNIPAGCNWTFLSTDLQKIALGRAFNSWGGRVGFCRRLSWDKPSPTLTSAPNGRATTLCHPDELRPLSIREYAKLQQFPSRWKFIGSTRQKYLQIGNAVPIGLGRAIGKMLIKVSDTKGSTDKCDHRLRGKVVCADPMLATRLNNRSRTNLNPPRLREIQSKSAATKWIKEIAK